MAAVLIAPIRFYKRFISPILPSACRFEPTCSVYAMEAIAVHGAAHGMWLAIKRLGRCHPITWLGGSSGFDPVPSAHDAAGHSHHTHECNIHHG